MRVKGAFKVEGERSPVVMLCPEQDIKLLTWLSGKILWSVFHEGATADDEGARHMKRTWRSCPLVLAVTDRASLHLNVTGCDDVHKKLIASLGIFVQRLKSHVRKPERRWMLVNHRLIFHNQFLNQFPQCEWVDHRVQEPDLVQEQLKRTQMIVT